MAVDRAVARQRARRGRGPATPPGSWAEQHPICADLWRYGGETGVVGFCRTWLHHRGFRFMVLHRLCTRRRRGWPPWLLCRALLERASVKYGIEISSRATIGAGLHISHFGGITIGPTTLGPDCNIAKGVTIGNIPRGPRQGRPIVGRAVWIGVGATLVGGITIGDGAAIAPGAYVNFDVPAGALVLGNPATVVGAANPDNVGWQTAELTSAPRRGRGRVTTPTS